MSENLINHSFDSLAEVNFIATNTYDAYQAHQLAWKFIGQSPGEKRHFHHDFNFMPDNRGALITVRADHKYLPDLATKIKSDYRPGSILSFYLSASATKKRRLDNKEEPCVTHADLIQWIDARSERSGFSVIKDDLETHTEPFLIRKPGNQTFYLNKAFFKGRLTITDTDLFSLALAEGIGRHKGLGFGMLKIINQ